MINMCKASSRATSIIRLGSLFFSLFLLTILLRLIITTTTDIVRDDFHVFFLAIIRTSIYFPFLFLILSVFLFLYLFSSPLFLPFPLFSFSLSPFFLDASCFSVSLTWHTHRYIHIQNILTHIQNIRTENNTECHKNVKRDRGAGEGIRINGSDNCVQIPS